tara:strand:+ start:417 stop:590 length:174 start_codon:yes stop_codon:yes gene_type:complete
MPAKNALRTQTTTTTTTTTTTPKSQQKKFFGAEREFNPKGRGGQKEKEDIFSVWELS